MRRLLQALVILLGFGGTAWADDWRDCSGLFGNVNNAIRACTNIITAGRSSHSLADAYENRGFAHYKNSNFDQAIADYTRVIELNPKHAYAYLERGRVYYNKGNFDQAITDETKAIELNPQYADAYSERGGAYRAMHKYDQAIADETRAIELNPRLAVAYTDRGYDYRQKGDYDKSIADETKAIELNPHDAYAFANRGFAYGGSGDYDRDITDQNKAIELKADLGPAYYGRGEAYAAKGVPEKALADFHVAAQQLPTGDERRGKAQARVADLEKQLAVPAPGPRVALVIGNSAYRSVPSLNNPVNDASLISSALKADGFDVTVADNLDRDGLIDALKTFATKADSADWAVVYFAGHGIEMGGTNYLIPIDAKL
jgi:tetratricopeptide (TPR) repeat protein